MGYKRFKLQMKYKLSTINFSKTCLDDICSLQRDNVCCDLMLVFESDSIWIHRVVLEMLRVWWASLLRDSSTCDQVVRMDYILEGEIWRKLFQNHVENLHKYYKSVRMQIKTFQEKDLLHNEEQTLTEEELLLICSDRMSENIFHGFSVRKLEIC